MNYLWPRVIERREATQRYREDPAARELPESWGTAGPRDGPDLPVPGTRAWLASQNDIGRLVDADPGARDQLWQAVLIDREYRATIVTRTPSPTPSEGSDDARNKYGHKYDPCPTLLTTEFDVDVDDGRRMRAETRINLAEWDGYLNFPEEAASALVALEPEAPIRPRDHGSVRGDGHGQDLPRRPAALERLSPYHGGGQATLGVLD